MDFHLFVHTSLSSLVDFAYLHIKMKEFYWQVNIGVEV